MAADTRCCGRAREMPTALHMLWFCGWMACLDVGFNSKDGYRDRRRVRGRVGGRTSMVQHADRQEASDYEAYKGLKHDQLEPPTDDFVIPPLTGESNFSLLSSDLDASRLPMPNVLLDQFQNWLKRPGYKSKDWKEMVDLIRVGSLSDYDKWRDRLFNYSNPKRIFNWTEAERVRVLHVSRYNRWKKNVDRGSGVSNSKQFPWCDIPNILKQAFALKCEKRLRLWRKEAKRRDLQTSQHAKQIYEKIKTRHGRDVFDRECWRDFRVQRTKELYDQGIDIGPTDWDAVYGLKANVTDGIGSAYNPRVMRWAYDIREMVYERRDRILQNRKPTALENQWDPFIQVFDRALPPSSPPQSAESDPSADQEQPPKSPKVSPSGAVRSGLKEDCRAVWGRPTNRMGLALRVAKKKDQRGVLREEIVEAVLVNEHMEIVYHKTTQNKTQREPQGQGIEVISLKVLASELRNIVKSRVVVVEAGVGRHIITLFKQFANPNSNGNPNLIPNPNPNPNQNSNAKVSQKQPEYHHPHQPHSNQPNCRDHTPSETYRKKPITELELELGFVLRDLSRLSDRNTPGLIHTNKIQKLTAKGITSLRRLGLEILGDAGPSKLTIRDRAVLALKIYLTCRLNSLRDLPKGFPKGAREGSQMEFPKESSHEANKGMMRDPSRNRNAARLDASDAAQGSVSGHESEHGVGHRDNYGSGHESQHGSGHESGHVSGHESGHLSGYGLDISAVDRYSRKIQNVLKREAHSLGFPVDDTDEADHQHHQHEIRFVERSLSGGRQSQYPNNRSNHNKPNTHDTWNVQDVKSTVSYSSYRNPKIIQKKAFMTDQTTSGDDAYINNREKMDCLFQNRIIINDSSSWEESDYSRYDAGGSYWKDDEELPLPPPEYWPETYR
ncbi:hypothetical protein AAMO2058_001394500 [Amorphochlora amoebiformis]